MSERVRDDSGQFARKLTDEDVLAVLVHGTTDAEPMLTAGEVAAVLSNHRDLDVTDETVRRRLAALEREGRVASKRFGARAVGWTGLVDPDPGSEVGEALAAVREATDVEGWLDDRSDDGDGE